MRPADEEKIIRAVTWALFIFRGQWPHKEAAVPAVIETPVGAYGWEIVCIDGVCDAGVRERFCHARDMRFRPW